ncbi:hypothetical protein [Roseibaca sp. Y0-43]|uniref:hypothetical protein n=1 Tax=Roseibaca sp. Y0-43 TaxID=2816854 RepID=UPI001D0CB6DD|nr:hypothetical protein [Roseibaca sp. Y0-43]MCC1481437.1 hypothetical protein [Roseibaca sp. Y0-43]
MEDGLGAWFNENKTEQQLSSFGFRTSGGGAHQSKTMMLPEVESLLSSGITSADSLKIAAIDDNIMGKSTANTRRLTYRHLCSLYGFNDQPPITKVMVGLWPQDREGHALLTLLVALARDPLLRDTAKVVLGTPVGQTLERPNFEDALSSAHPDRFSYKMVRSMAQNCASTWTHSGHLSGRAKKTRQRVSATPHATTLAALCATAAGYGGPAILGSVWMKVLDLSPEQALDQMRRAESLGLARVRSAGDVTEISVRQPLSSTLGVSELEHV